MKRILLAIAAVATIAMASPQSASAHNPAGYGLGVFGGFYQPYGARFNTAGPRPPYFALNPPVYYGARYARPYGMSPFAALPSVNTPADYKSRQRTNFYAAPRTAPVAAPTCGDCYSDSKAVDTGLVRMNPFVAESQLATN